MSINQIGVLSLFAPNLLMVLLVVVLDIYFRINRGNMKTLATLSLLLLIVPNICHAQDLSTVYAPDRQIKCNYNIALKDVEYCQRMVKTFNSMTPAQKQEHNRQVKENKDEQYRQQTLSELREMNRHLSGRWR
jgi:hypothetical protein